MTAIPHATHRTEESPMPGRHYQCLFNGVPLYEARIKNISGCWASVEVIQPISGPHEGNYKNGQTFDIRISSYTFEEKT